MLNKRNLSNVKYPALVLFLITFLVVTLSDSLIRSASFYSVLVSVFSSVICCLIFEIFAYITCWALILRKGKGNRAVWVNYILWILFANLGTIANLLE